MIEEERPDIMEGEYEEFDVKNWGGEAKKPSNWDHEPKRGKKKSKKEGEHTDDGPSEKEEKRKQKIELKILRKVVQETNENVHQGPVSTSHVSKVDRDVEAICNILKYMLGEYCIDGVPEYANEERTVEKWELDEIIKQVKDTNLGDFVIKCPNPDNLPTTWVDKYEVKEVDGELTS